MTISTAHRYPANVVEGNLRFPPDFTYHGCNRSRFGGEWLQRNLLGEKLAALQAGIEKGTGELWTKQFNHEFFVVLKKLGNDAMHAKAAEVSFMAERHDEALYRSCEISIGQLLEVVYERPHKEQEHLAKLKGAILPRGQK